ncbi:melibiase domain-containing protein [Sarocladium implicatum]|nr:melibiase domain-containing protein [Sarocladium implicatum]
MTSLAISILSEHTFGDVTARYTTDSQGHVGLWLYPTSARSKLADRRTTVADESWVRDKAKAKPAIVVESLVHLKITGDDQPGQFGPGRTSLWAISNDRFRLASQERKGDAVVTVLTDPTGLKVEHRLIAGYQDLTLRSETRFINDSQDAVRLELLTSFALSGITPFASERAYAGNIKLSERFGQIGSMPTRGWFPTALVEDTEAQVVWGARLACPTSWQLEAARRYDDLVLAGGYADREFGHWTKTVQPGESFSAAPAWLTCVSGTIDDACDRLLSVDKPAIETQPSIEKDLPVAYCDYCTSWGAPQEDVLLKTADILAPLGVEYLVIDAGWYMPEEPGAHWATTMGDWKANSQRFPNGLKATADAIRARGMTPGLWMEPEHVARDSAAFHETAHMLQRDGKTLTLELRRAWDLHDPWVKDYIDERVIRTLSDAGMGFFKLDYSESLGIGVDHPDGLGEGLRRHGEGTHAMLERIRSRMPDLVTELVSAGGNRLEASLLQRVSMASSSDAHETLKVPLVSAALQRLILPQQSTIWAVLNRKDTLQRLGYTLASTFLGRMYLSGEVEDLAEDQVDFLRKAIDMYKQSVPAICDGTSRIQGDVGESWRHPQGWQGVVRSTCSQVLVVIHTFEKSPRDLTVELPRGSWRIDSTLTSMAVEIGEDGLKASASADFEGQVVLLSRQ